MDAGTYISEQADGTPFSRRGADMMKRLGILLIVLPAVSAILAWGICTIFSVPQVKAPDLGSEASIVLGIMLILVSVLIWCGDYMVSMDGFQLLHCGYRPTAVRGGILVPFTLSMGLQKKWTSAILAILAEACIVWTLYGMGVCLAAGRREGRKCRNS